MDLTLIPMPLTSVTWRVTGGQVTFRWTGLPIAYVVIFLSSVQCAASGGTPSSQRGSSRLPVGRIMESPVQPLLTLFFIVISTTAAK